MSECSNGCEENYADDTNHHHHDFSHSHTLSVGRHEHINLLDTGMVLYEIVEGAGKEWQDFKPMLNIMKRDGCLVRVWPENGADDG